MLAPMASGARSVFQGLEPWYREFCEGYTAGHDDGAQGLPADSTLMAEQSNYANGYRHGYGDARKYGGKTPC